MKQRFGNGHRKDGTKYTHLPMRSSWHLGFVKIEVEYDWSWLNDSLTRFADGVHAFGLACRRTQVALQKFNEAMADIVEDSLDTADF